MRREQIVAWIERALGRVVAACMFAMMSLMFVDVVARKLLGTSVPGGVELIELLMLGVVFAGLPIVSLKGEHIVLDLLDHLLPARLRRLQERIANLASALLLAGAGVLVLERAGRTLEYGDVTPALAIGLGRFHVAIGVLLFVTAAVHLLLLAAPAAPPDATEAPR